MSNPVEVTRQPLGTEVCSRAEAQYVHHVKGEGTYLRFDGDLADKHIGTLKKFATGRGNAQKHEMVAAAKSEWPHLDICDDNIADALHLLNYGRENK